MSKQRVALRIATAPHSPEQRMIMNAFFIPGLLEMWIACGTKFGKTFALATAVALASPLTRQAMWRWIAPVYSQSAIGFRYCRRMLPRDERFVKPNESSLSISYPPLDTLIQFFHGQNPESIEGEATAGNVFDEAAKLKEAVYQSTKSTTTVTEGPIVGASTPNGKNYFYRKCMEAKEEMIRARFENRRPTKIFIHAPSRANPAVSQIVLDDARKTLPRRIFEQLYEAAFNDDGSIFLYLTEAFGGGEYLNEFTHDQTWYREKHKSEKIFVGADWGKKADSSVFYALNEHGKNIGFKRMGRIGYVEQVAALRSFCDTVYRNSEHPDKHLSGLHDKTGVGEAIDDIIQASNFPYDIVGITWNNLNKEVAVNDLILSFEEKCLGLYPWETLRTELTTFEVSTTKTGKPHYAASEGEHDDTVMSLVLANMLYREGRDMVTGVGFVDQINNLVTSLYYNGESFLED